MTTAVKTSFLRTGEEFKDSLRDGREVWYDGERVDDVTTHFATAGGIDLIARGYDAQHEPETQDVLTIIREDGARISKAWMVPRTKEDLKSRREAVEHLARSNFGIFGRQMDMIATTQVGMAAFEHLIREHSPDYANNIRPYIQWAGENNIMLAAPVADPQGWRTRGSALGRRGVPLFDTSDGGEAKSDVDLHIDGKVIPGALRVVKENDDGVWISGAKVVGSVAPQCNEMIVSNIALPDPTPEGAFWMLVPVGSEGVRLISREATVHSAASFHDHPIASLGEEIDALVIFEDVFVPRWRVCSYRWTDIGKYYGQIAALEHWHTLTKLAVKADLFVGLVQLVCDGIGTSHRPGVRQLIAEVIEYAQILRGMVLASEENAQFTESGVMWPDWKLVTAGRSHALSMHPHIVHLVQELCGQGPILRWSQKDLDNPVIGPRIEWFYEGAAISARDKNLLMNLVWDLTTSSHAGRVRLFENVNGFPVPYLRERMYLEYDRRLSMSFIRSFLGLSDDGSPKIDDGTRA
jgi:4-hydroxyphenylacetate 3-monooxygenase